MDCTPLKRSSAFGPAIVLFLAVLTWPGALTAQTPARPADGVLTGTIAGDDNRHYKRIPFTLPEGTDRLVVAFDYDQRDKKTMIDLGIEDPHGFRGASGGNKADFTIAETDATPSYLPGRLDPGSWALSLAIPNIRAGVTAHWTARLWFLKGAEAQTLPGPTAGRGPGWYRGDLHLHSAHSDGSCESQAGRKVPCPLFRTLEVAAERHLDFIAVTEHNTASHVQVLREAQPYFDRLLLIPGREITTFYGHFNIFGITSPIDFRIAPGIDNSFDRIADHVHALGGLVSINHPRLPSGEACMGCGWTMPDVDYSKVDAIEAINGASVASLGGNPEGAMSGIPFWLDHLRDRAVSAVGGSDNHGPDRDGLGGVGAPLTVVEAADLTEPAILDGIRHGRVFILVRDPGVPVRLDFALRAGSRQVPMGAGLSAPAKIALTLIPDVAGPSDATLEILDGATLLRSLALNGSVQRTAQPLALAPGVHEVRVQLRGADGVLLALGNAVRLQVAAP